MKLIILGTGCSKCQALHRNVLTAVQELGISAEVIKLEDIVEIMRYNVLTLPALVINEKVAAIGVQNVEQVKTILNHEKDAKNAHSNASCTQSSCMCD